MSMSYSMRHAQLNPAALAAARATAAGAGSSGGVLPSLALGGAPPPVGSGANSYGASSAAHGPPAAARGGSGNGSGSGSGNAFLGGSNLCMLALCEVAQVPGLTQPNPNPQP